MKRPVITTAFLVVFVTGAIALATSSETAAKVLNFGIKSEAGDRQHQTNPIVLSNSQQNIASSIVQPDVAQIEPIQIESVNSQTPDFVFFDMLLNLVRAMDEAAARLEQQQVGSGRIWREYFQRHVGLTSQQANMLRQVANEFHHAVEPTHQQAMQIINARRATATSGQRPTPPPPQLLALQQQRQTIALTHGVRLRNLLSAEVVARLRQLMTQPSGSRIAEPLSDAERQLLREQINRKENQNNE